MKLIIVNKKRLGVTVIIVGLMLVLFGLENKFDGRLKYTALIQSNINSLKKYEIPEVKFSYKLPSNWQTKKQSFSGSEVLYHNDFTSEDGIIHGFVQVWSINEDLKSFLDRSLRLSQKYAEYTEYNITPIVVKKHDGYLLTYRMMTSKEGNYKGYEYFIKDKDKFIRFTFYVRDLNFKENMPTIFKAIVDTFEENQ
ncbi:PsbP-related protein [Candidatus Clostridium radicumherbarum]|uniref:PsbP-related protein n=1 Tax=Candidatus Clostridium radicumherbarum TaxID=3381662 RepID=A0ABW8TPP7_9CLOT